MASIECLFRRLQRGIGGLGVALSLLASAHAAPVADSIGDFSAVQGQGGWTYGYFNTTANGAYTVGGFVEFALFDVV